MDPVSGVWFGFLFKDPALEEDTKQKEVEEGEATCRESCSDGESCRRGKFPMFRHIIGVIV